MKDFLNTLKRNAAVVGVMSLGVLAVGSAVLLSRTSSLNPVSTDAALNTCEANYVIARPSITPCLGSIDVNLILDRSSSMNTLYNGETKLKWEKKAMLAFLKSARERASTNKNLSVWVGVTSYGAQGNIADGETLKLGNAYRSNLHTPRLLDIASATGYDSLVGAVNSVSYNASGNGTCTECGLRIGRKQLFSGFTRQSLVKANVLVADGLSNRVWDGTGYLENGNPPYLDESPSNPANLKAVAESKLGKNVGIDQYVVGYGTGTNINRVTLKNISNTGSTPYYFENPDPAVWTASMIKVLDNLCKVSTQRAI